MAREEPTSTRRPRRASQRSSPADQARDLDASWVSIQSKTFIIVLSLSALFVGLYIQVTKNISQSLSQNKIVVNNLDDTLIVADNVDAGYLDHIVDALLDHDHKLSFRGSLTTASSKDIDQFKLIWTHDYPFQMIKKLEPRQRINHFPGTGFITNKVTLSTTTKVPHVLKAFRIPQDKDQFLEYSKSNPEKRWIQKSSGHRGISIETADTVNLEAKDTLIQEYMENPLLIDGKKFDIGIYAVLTSVEPLRAYMYEAESLLRFCSHPYIDPRTGKFNSSDLDSFVVGDDYTPIWLMPSLLRHYIGANLSMKQTLNTYLLQFNLKGDKIWDQIEETIMKVYKVKEIHLARMSRMYQEANNYNSTSVQGSLNQFFEMVRFDFIVDKDLNVYLMEANMSPNLSSRHFPPNRLLYEPVLKSYFSLAGLTQFSQRHLTDLPVHHLDGTMSLPQKSVRVADGRYGLEAMISEKELSVYEELCVSDECHMNCQKVDCQVCYFCLSGSDKLHIRRAIFEQNSRWNFKRLLPSTRDEDLKLQLVNPENNLQSVDSNYIHVQWFRGKCYTDHRYCSY